MLSQPGHNIYVRNTCSILGLGPRASFTPAPTDPLGIFPSKTTDSIRVITSPLDFYFQAHLSIHPTFSTEVANTHSINLTYSTSAAMSFVPTPKSPRREPSESDVDADHQRNGNGNGSIRAASRRTRQQAPFSRSCHLCSQRKVRCDKKQPCGTCSRVGRPCVYPPADQPIRRPRKATVADVAIRMSRLERSINSLSRPPVDATSPSPTHIATSQWLRETQPSPTIITNERSSSAPPPSSRASDIGDVLLRNGSSSQYFNDILLSRAIEEVGSQI